MRPGAFVLAFVLSTTGMAVQQDRRPVGEPDPPPAVPREFRAAYATPMWDRGFRDWPSVAGLSPDSQRAEMRTMLDNAQAMGLNAIVLHVRMAGDAMYPTSFAPWSGFISGTMGVGPSPTYDPLAYAVKEAHARGLQLHAWFNPFRAMIPLFKNSVASTHVTKKHPEWIRKYGSQTWIDPGDPAARQWVLDGMLDVVKRYDVDGVHIDDYFYPYREARTFTRRVRGKRVRSTVDIPFPDDRTWKKYGAGKGYSSRDAWRRANIDDFVHDLYRGVKAIKPAVLVGIGPFGIWRPGSPEGVRGLDAFSEIYADSRKWLAEGWLDYIAPQLYWEVGGTQDRFRALDAWWRRQNPKDRYVWPALYTSHVFGGRDAWDLSEIRTQIATIRRSRDSTEVPGHVHFRLGAMWANNNVLANDVAQMYRDRAIVPAFPWLGAAVPASPTISLVNDDGPMQFSIAPGDSVKVRWWLIQTRGRDGRWTTNLRATGGGPLGAASFGTEDPDEIAVTALSPTGVASLPAIFMTAGVRR